MMRYEHRLGSASLFALFLLLAATTAGGCAVEVGVGRELMTKSVEVKLVGIPPQDYQKWYEKSMTEYWKPGDPFRTEAIREGYAFVMEFGQGKAGTKSLRGGQPVWKKWDEMNARYLFVLANLAPGSDKAGWMDFRREIVRMRPWPILGPVIQARVKQSGVGLLNVLDRKLPKE